MPLQRKAGLKCLNNIHKYFIHSTQNEGSVSSTNDECRDHEWVFETSSSSDSGFMQTSVDKSHESDSDISNYENESNLETASLISENNSVNTDEILFKNNFIDFFNNFTELLKSPYWAQKIFANKGNAKDILFYLNEALFSKKEFFIDMSKTKRKDIFGSLHRLNVTVGSESNLKPNWLQPLSSISAHNPIVDQHGVMINTGTYIRKMSWAPTYPEINLDQLLAVAVYKELTERLNINDNSNPHDQMIQIYNCGQLKMNTREAYPPRLEMVFVHNWGKVADMTWCPQPLPIVRTSQKLLGHLALCCSDGFIRIIPICKLQNPGCFVTLDKNHPVLCLGAIRNRGQSAYPTTMHWRQEFPNRIVAGYNTGHIGLFVLEKSVFTSRSSLVGSNIYLKPSVFRKVFDSPCRSVQINPHNWNQVVCSAYFATNVVTIDFDQHSGRNLPIYVGRENNIDCQVFWPSTGNTIVMGSKKFLYSDLGILLHSNQIKTKPQMKLLFDDISVINMCYALNVVPVGTRSGRFYVFNLKKVNDMIIKKRNICQKIAIEKSYHLNALNPTKFKSTENSESGLNTNPGCKCPSTIFCVHRLISNYSISINKTSVRNSNDWQLDSMIKVHEIAINPNPSSSTWVALGLECGLIHIVPMTHFYRSEFDKLYGGKSCEDLNLSAISLSTNMFLNQSVLNSKRGRPREKLYKKQTINNSQDISQSTLNEIHFEISKTEMESSSIDCLTNVTTESQKLIVNKRKRLTTRDIYLQVFSAKRKKISTDASKQISERQDKSIGGKENDKSSPCTKSQLPDYITEMSVKKKIITSSDHCTSQVYSRMRLRSDKLSSTYLDSITLEESESQIGESRPKSVKNNSEHQISLRSISHSNLDILNLTNKESHISIADCNFSKLPIFKGNTKKSKIDDSSISLNISKQCPSLELKSVKNSENNSSRRMRLRSDDSRNNEIHSKTLSLEKNSFNTEKLKLNSNFKDLMCPNQEKEDSLISKVRYNRADMVHPDCQKENQNLSSSNEEFTNSKSVGSRMRLRSANSVYHLSSEYTLQSCDFESSRCDNISSQSPKLYSSNSEDKESKLAINEIVSSKPTTLIKSKAHLEKQIKNKSPASSYLKNHSYYDNKSKKQSTKNSLTNVCKKVLEKENCLQFSSTPRWKLRSDDSKHDISDFAISTSEVKKETSTISQKNVTGDFDEDISNKKQQESFITQKTKEHSISNSSTLGMKLRSGISGTIFFDPVIMIEKNLCSAHNNFLFQSPINSKSDLSKIKNDGIGNRDKNNSCITPSIKKIISNSSISRMRHSKTPQSVVSNALNSVSKRKRSDLEKSSTEVFSTLSACPKIKILESDYNFSESSQNKNDISVTTRSSTLIGSRKNTNVNCTKKSKNSKITIKPNYNVLNNNTKSTESILKSNFVSLHSSENHSLKPNINLYLSNESESANNLLSSVNLNLENYPSEFEIIDGSSLDSFENSVFRKGSRKIPRISSDTEENCDIDCIKPSRKNKIINGRLVNEKKSSISCDRCAKKNINFKIDKEPSDLCLNEDDVGEKFCRRILRSDVRVLQIDSGNDCSKDEENVSREQVECNLKIIDCRIKSFDNPKGKDQTKYLNENVNLCLQSTGNKNTLNDQNQQVNPKSFFQNEHILLQDFNRTTPSIFKRRLKTDIDDEDIDGDQIDDCKVTLKSCTRLTKRWENVELLKMSSLNSFSNEIGGIRGYSTDLKQSLKEQSGKTTVLQKNSVSTRHPKDNDNKTSTIPLSLYEKEPIMNIPVENSIYRINSKIELNLKSVQNTTKQPDQKETTSHTIDKSSKEISESAKAKTFIKSKKSSDPSFIQRENIRNNNQFVNKSVNVSKFNPKLFSTPKNFQSSKKVKEKSKKSRVSLNERSFFKSSGSIINERRTKKMKNEKFNVKQVKKLHEIFAIKRQEMFSNQASLRQTGTPLVSCSGSNLNHKKTIFSTNYNDSGSEVEKQTNIIQSDKQIFDLNKTTSTEIEQRMNEKSNTLSIADKSVSVKDEKEKNHSRSTSKSNCRQSWWGTDTAEHEIVGDVNEKETKSLKINNEKGKYKKSKSFSEKHMDKIKKVIGDVISQLNGEKESINDNYPELLQPFRSLKGSNKTNNNNLLTNVL